MKYIMFILAALLLVSSVAAKIEVYQISSFGADTIELKAILSNKDDTKMKDVTLHAYLPVTGEIYRENMGSIRSDDSGSAHILLDVPESMAPDYYPLIITTFDRYGERQKTHSWIYLS